MSSSSNGRPAPSDGPPPPSASRFHTSPYLPPPDGGGAKPALVRAPPPGAGAAAAPDDESRHPPSSGRRDGDARPPSSGEGLRHAASADERVQPSDSCDGDVHPADRWGRTVAVSANGVLPRGGPGAGAGAGSGTSRREDDSGRDPAPPPPAGAGFAPSRSGAFAPYYKPAAVRAAPPSYHPGMGPPAYRGPPHGSSMRRPPFVPVGGPPPRQHPAGPPRQQQARGRSGSDAQPGDLRTVPTSDSMEGLVRAAEHVMEQELRERSSSAEDDVNDGEKRPDGGLDDSTATSVRRNGGNTAPAPLGRPAARRPAHLPALSTGTLPPNKRPIGAVNVDDATPKHFNTAGPHGRFGHDERKRMRVAEGGRYDPARREHPAYGRGGEGRHRPEQEAEARQDGSSRPRGDSSASDLRQAHSYLSRDSGPPGSGIDPAWSTHVPRAPSVRGEVDYPYEPASYLGSGSLSFEVPPHALSALRSFPDLNDDMRPSMSVDMGHSLGGLLGDETSKSATTSPKPDEKEHPEEAGTPPLPHQGSMPIKKRIAGMMMSPGGRTTGEAASRSPHKKDKARMAEAAAASRKEGGPTRDEAREETRDQPEDDGSRTRSGSEHGRQIPSGHEPGHGRPSLRR